MKTFEITYCGNDSGEWTFTREFDDSDKNGINRAIGWACNNLVMIRNLTIESIIKITVEYTDTLK